MGEESEPEPGTRWVGLYCRLRTRFDACQTLLSICIIMQYIIEEIYALSSFSRALSSVDPCRIRNKPSARHCFFYFFVMFFLASSNRLTTS